MMRLPRPKSDIRHTSRTCSGISAICLALILCGSLLSARTVDAAEALIKESSETLQVAQPQERSFRLAANQSVEVFVRVARPSSLPANTALHVSWELLESDDDAERPRGPNSQEETARESDAFGIYQAPTANWSKRLHALDSDLFLVYRAPVSGIYRLRAEPGPNAPANARSERWREKGQAPQLVESPTKFDWPQDCTVELSLRLRPIDIRDELKNRIFVEVEPNDTPEQAQQITIGDVKDEFTINLIGTSDDIEYFDNQHVGASGDDWVRIHYQGNQPRLLTGCLSIPDQQVAARIRVYRIPSAQLKEWREPAPGQLVSLEEYTDGKNQNERVHQQEEQHRIAITRNLEPGGIYFLRIESNAPGYDLELRTVQPAPYAQPARAIRQALYDHIGQVDAWLTNRPRGASVERRIRDSGNLLGTNCMSCHTQSGVWGPAIPLAYGYTTQNVQLWRHLINTCYQSLRPTNELKEAANNTSLRPLDIGDGPAGTRVAGHAVAALERTFPARALQGKQSKRTANYVLLTADPGGINAAGPGANVGQGVVFNYAGEILWTNWRDSGEPRYFRGLEDKARRMLDINVKYTDDLGHRIEFFTRYFPADYLEASRRVAKQEGKSEEEQDRLEAAAKELATRIQQQLANDLERLRSIQLEGGGWSFDPGRRSDDGDRFEVKDKKAEPSPTALALIAFEAAGVGRTDPVVERGIKALLGLQHPSGYWKGASQTGFVATSYALHALARFFPNKTLESDLPPQGPASKETLTATIRRVRDTAVTQHPAAAPSLIVDAGHPSPLVRFWAVLGLGYSHTESGVATLVEALGDPAKSVREAAHWSLRQTLIDDQGWQSVLTACSSQDDYVREAALRSLIMKVDTVMPSAHVDLHRLALTFDQALNRDPAPGVRAWATRAAWQWWVWNPPIRRPINAAWTKLLTRPESEILVENAIRYQSHALFIANGHVANGSKEHQYRELSQLFSQIHDSLKASRKSADHVLERRLTERLVAIAATFYNQRGGDGGPGQLGYVTPGAGSLFGDAILGQLNYVESLPDNERFVTLMRGTLEGAANIPLETLQEKLVDYSINGQERFRSVAASSISDPRLVSLIAVPEKLEPMHRQLVRGAQEPPRRKDLSDPIMKMFGSVHWILPETQEQRLEILQYLIPPTSQYRNQASIEELSDPAVQAAAGRDRDAAWYLADGLGAAVANNPDLHFEELAESYPHDFANDAEARFWMRSVPWLLEFQRDLPEIAVDPKKLPPVDPYEELRTRALRLFLSQLTKEADGRNRSEAVNLANQTALKKNPEVLTALADLVQFEADKKIVENANKVLSQSSQTFQKELATALEKDGQFKFEPGSPPEDFVQDLTYFRDYVLPEMTKVLRGDERSCMICHGEPGRVPSMELYAPDQVGYLPVDKLLANYRILQQRIDIEETDKSKLLRKPLNIQTGQEDGHQGGRRYQPDDAGYLILTRWAQNQIEIQKAYGVPKPADK